MAVGFSDIISRGLARLTGAQRTAGGTAVPALTSGNVLLDASGNALSLGGLPSGLSYTSNILQQSNGTNAQRYRIFNTGNTTSGEWFDIDWQTTANSLTVGPRAAGTGTLRAVIAIGNWTFAPTVDSTSSVRWTNAAGSVIASIDAANRRFHAGGGAGASAFSVSVSTGVASVYDNGAFGFCSSAVADSQVDTAFRRHAAGVAAVTLGPAGQFGDLRLRSVIQQPPASITPASNGDFVFEATSNTTYTVKYRGSDGVVRSDVRMLV